MRAHRFLPVRVRGNMSSPVPETSQPDFGGRFARAVRIVCLAFIVVLLVAGGHRESRAMPVAGCTEQAAGMQGFRTGAVIEPACLVEWLGILRSYWDLGLGLILNGEPGTSCYRLAVTGDVLSVIESVLTYSLCVMREADEPDENMLQRREITRKTVLIIYEFLYIVDLLTCYPTR
jgi:hypothetical protein